MEIDYAWRWSESMPTNGWRQDFYSHTGREHLEDFRDASYPQGWPTSY